MAGQPDSNALNRRACTDLLETSSWSGGDHGSRPERLRPRSTDHPSVESARVRDLRRHRDGALRAAAFARIGNVAEYWFEEGSAYQVHLVVTLQDGLVAAKAVSPIQPRPGEAGTN